MTDETTLAEARTEFWSRIVRGTRCPCCDRYAKAYRRKFNSGMARSLIAMYRFAGRSWVHLPTSLPARSREEGKLAYWGLAEESTERREDGGRAGWWRVSAAGEKFVSGNDAIAGHAITYNRECLGLDRRTVVTITEALGDGFDYEELMYG